ncbi:AMP-binding protein [Gordonia sp. KTR9]|uniref:AMP-binding protein n=1 Tax=Gordonia sp. KTR9 TaxID=337191 RepID=UPI0011D1E42C
MTLYFGASRAGVVPVPLNFRLAPPEWEYIVTDAGCRLAVVHEDHAAALGAVLPADPTRPRRES